MSHRKKIYDQICNRNIDTKLIKYTFKLINTLYDNIDIRNITFLMSNKMKKIAGSLRVYYDEHIYTYELVISKYILDHLFERDTQYHRIHGIKCYDKTECFIVLLEHEYLHYLLLTTNKHELYCRHTHSTEFKKLMYSMFSHTSCHHELSR